MNMTTNRRCPRHSASRLRRGFTQIEFFVVIAVIVILPGMLAPTLTRARAMAINIEAGRILLQVGKGVSAYIDDQESRNDAPLLPVKWDQLYPTWVSEDVFANVDEQGWAADTHHRYAIVYPPRREWLKQPSALAGCTYDETQFDGRVDSIDGDCLDLVVIARAVELPGVGGIGHEVHLYADRHVESLPSPDATNEAELQIKEIQLDGLEAAVDLLKIAGESAPSPESLKSEISDPEVTLQAARFFDRDGDGFVTATDILLLDSPSDPPNEENRTPGSDPPPDEPTPNSILQSLITDTLTILDLDPTDPVFDELPKIAVADLAAQATLEAGDLFSFENVAELSIDDSSDSGVGAALAAKLFAAGAAEDRGELETRNEILGAYRNQLRAQTGKTLWSYDADTLKILSRVLQPNP